MRVWIGLAQIACVAALAAAVSWPAYRPTGAASRLWRADGPLVPRPDLVAGDSRFSYRPADGTGSASADGVDAADAAGVGAAGRRGTGPSNPGATVRNASLGESAQRRSAVRGRACTVLNQPVAFAQIVLRDRLTGIVQATTTSDSNGQFLFENLPSTTFVVELLGAGGDVIAATTMTAVPDRVQWATLRIGTNGTPRALFGTAAGSETVYYGSTASEPIGRAAAQGVAQATAPKDHASPRY